MTLCLKGCIMYNFVSWHAFIMCFLLSSPDFFLFNVCLVRCIPRCMSTNMHIGIWLHYMFCFARKKLYSLEILFYFLSFQAKKSKIYNRFGRLKPLFTFPSIDPFHIVQNFWMGPDCNHRRPPKLELLKYHLYIISYDVQI